MGDNLEHMARLEDDSVNLIYMDPPFATGRIMETTLVGSGSNSKSSVTEFFGDKWQWDEGFDASLRNALAVLPRRAAKVLLALIETQPRSALAAYLLMMAPRLYESWRLLDSRGSLYVHCDPTASAYLKVFLDSVFGRDNFRNEIVWRRTHAHSGSRRYGPIHDTILFYTKSTCYTWTSPKTSYSPDYVRKFYRHIDQRGPYQLITCTGPGERLGTRAHYRWKGKWPPAGRHWAWTVEQMKAFEEKGLLVYSKNGVPRLKRYLDESPGVPLQDLWVDIDRLDAHSDERLGFATQKPIALLKRIIEASTHPGDIVLDPFCGTGTTLVAAERLNRSWVGIDASPLAASMALGRIRQELITRPVRLIGFPSTVDEAVALRNKDPLAYGVWGVSSLGAIATHRNLDKGIVGGTSMPSGKTTLRVAAWVPVRADHDYRVPHLASGRSKAVGLVLRSDHPVDSILGHLRCRDVYTDLREVDLPEVLTSRVSSLGYLAGALS